MSNRRSAKAARAGFRGPFFPTGTDELHTAYAEAGKKLVINGDRLEEIGRRIKNFIDLVRPETADGYKWFWGLQFFIGGTLIEILFPWAQDWDREDGTETDRSVAIYVGGRGTVPDISPLLKEIAGNLRNDV